jgi:RNA polymerase sigma-70 factor (ECF subfamily)
MMDESCEWDQFVEKLRRGDRETTQRFCREYGPLLWRLANRHMADWLRRRLDPEDVIQSVWCTFFRQLPANGFVLADSSALMHLLFDITLTKTCKWARFHSRCRRDGRREAAATASIDIVDNEPSPADTASLAEVLQRCLHYASDSERRVLDLLLEGLEDEQIATKLGWSERWVREQFRRFRKRLTDSLEVPLS